MSTGKSLDVTTRWGQLLQRLLWMSHEYGTKPL